MILSLKFKLLSTSILVLLIGVFIFSQYQINNRRVQLVQQSQNILQNVIVGLFSEGRMIKDNIRLPARVSFAELNQKGSGLVAVVCEESSKTLTWRSLSTQGIRQIDNACEKISYFLTKRNAELVVMNIDGIESRYGQVELGNVPLLMQMLRVQRYHSNQKQSYIIVVAQTAQELENQLNAFTKQVYGSSVLIFLFFTLILYITIQWSLASLSKLTDELNGIKQGKRDALSSGYEPELQGLTSTLNQLLHSEREQKFRYQHSMNDLAHSLKTRLAMLKAVSDEQDTKTNDFKQVLNEQVSQMDQIVHYQLRRAVSGRQSISSKPVLLAEEINKLTNTLTKVYRHKSIEFELIDPDRAAFFGQQDDLMEMMGNLLENACKFAISKVRVRCSVDKQQGLFISIEDDGPGVEMAIRDKILQRGVRADSSGGQGIGLAVSNEIINSYRGSIRIFDSELGGAGFALHFPLD